MVGELAEAMDNISLASSEQMQGISQVSIAVSQIDGGTQNNAALMEDSSAATFKTGTARNGGDIQDLSHICMLRTRLTRVHGCCFFGEHARCICARSSVLLTTSA